MSPLYPPGFISTPIFPVVYVDVGSVTLIGGLPTRVRVRVVFVAVPTRVKGVPWVGSVIVFFTSIVSFPLTILEIRSSLLGTDR